MQPFYFLALALAGVSLASPLGSAARDVSADKPKEPNHCWSNEHAWYECANGACKWHAKSCRGDKKGGLHFIKGWPVEPNDKGEKEAKKNGWKCDHRHRFWQCEDDSCHHHADSCKNHGGLTWIKGFKYTIGANDTQYKESLEPKTNATQAAEPDEENVVIEEVDEDEDEGKSSGGKVADQKADKEKRQVKADGPVVGVSEHEGTCDADRDDVEGTCDVHDDKEDVDSGEEDDDSGEEDDNSEDADDDEEGVAFSEEDNNSEDAGEDEEIVEDVREDVDASKGEVKHDGQRSEA